MRFKFVKLRYELYWALRKTCAWFNVRWMRITLIFPDGSKQSWYPRKSVMRRYVKTQINQDDYKKEFLSARMKKL